MRLRRGDVCLVNLASGLGHEQTGSRPAIILATTDTKIVVVIPITGNTDALRFSHTLLLKPTAKNGLHSNSVALVFHIRAVDMRRVERVYGHLESKSCAEIGEALRKLLAL
jgi:mRNA interferase MazF